MVDKSTQTDTQSYDVESAKSSSPPDQEAAAQTGNAWVDIVHRIAELELTHAIHKHEGLAVFQELLEHIGDHGARPTQHLDLRHESETVLQRVDEAIAMYISAAELEKQADKMRSELDTGETDTEDEEAESVGGDESEDEDEDAGGSYGWFNRYLVA